MDLSIKTKIDSISGILLVTDETSRILYANEAAVEKTGFCVAEAVGKRPGELWGGHMDKTFYQRMWRTISEEKKPFIATVSNNAKKGEEYQESLFILPLLEKSGDIRYFVQVKPKFQDVRKERQFRKAFAKREETLSQGDQLLSWILGYLGVKDLTHYTSGTNDIVEWIRTHLIIPTEGLFARRHKDALLIRQAQEDPATFAILYHRYAGKIERYFLERLNRDTDTAADLTQEVFVRSFRALPKFRITNASYYTYLLHVAHNVLVNHYRKQGNAEVPLYSEEAQQAAEDTEKNRSTKDILAALTNTERNIMLLKYEQGYKIKEIAEKIGKSDNAVKLILSRTRKKLRLGER